MKSNPVHRHSRDPDPEVRRAIDPETNEPMKSGGGNWLEGKKTYIGIALLILPTVLGWLGVETDKQELQGIINSALETVGGILAIYGRYDAAKRAKKSA